MVQVIQLNALLMYDSLKKVFFFQKGVKFPNLTELYSNFLCLRKKSFQDKSTSEFKKKV